MAKTTPAKIFHQLTLAELQQKRDLEGGSLGFIFDKVLEADLKAEQISLSFANKFRDEFEVKFGKHIRSHIEDMFGDSLVTIPADEIDVLKESLLSSCEEIMGSVIALLRPLDLADFASMLHERLKKVEESLRSSRVTMNDIPKQVWDMTTNSSNAIEIENFNSLYRRGLFEGLDLCIKTVCDLQKDVEERSNLLTSMSKRSKIKDK